MCNGLLFNRNYEFISHPFTATEKKVISVAGCIRGAIAFGLAMSFETGDVEKNTISLSTTLILVFVTTIVFGAWTPIISQRLIKEKSNVKIAESYLIEFKYEHPNNMSQSREENIESLTGLSKLWFELDSSI